MTLRHLFGVAITATLFFFTAILPTHPGTAIGAATAHAAPSATPSAATAGRPISAEDRERARRAFTDGLLLEQKGDVVTAIGAYREAVRADSTIPEAHYRMGRLLGSLDRLADAAKAYRNELHFRPTHVGANRELGLIEVRVGQEQKGVPRLERLVRAQPQDDQAWQALGFAYSIAGRPEDAEKALRKAVEYPPERAAEHRDLGVVLATLGREQDARSEYRAAIALDELDPGTWVNLGNLEARAKRWREALDAYQRAEAADSAYALALQGQVAALEALNEPAAAAETARRWLRVRPDDHRARLEAAARYQKLGQPDAALAIAREGVERNPNSGDAHVVLSSVYDAQGRPRDALRELRSAGRLFPDPLNRGQVAQMMQATTSALPESMRVLVRADSIAEVRGLAKRTH